MLGGGGGVYTLPSDQIRSTSQLKLCSKIFVRSSKTKRSRRRPNRLHNSRVNIVTFSYPSKIYYTPKDLFWLRACTNANCNISSVPFAHFKFISRSNSNVSAYIKRHQHRFVGTLLLIFETKRIESQFASVSMS